MTRNVRKETYEDMRIVPENCQMSGYTMAAVAGCLLFCVGIIIYALLAG